MISAMIGNKKNPRYPLSKFVFSYMLFSIGNNRFTSYKPMTAFTFFQYFVQNPSLPYF